MKVLDIDLDFFLDRVTFPISNENRYPDEKCEVWSKEKVVEYLEKTLKLCKNKKIKGRIITNHNESLNFWKEQIINGKLTVPFQIIHIDSHSDLDYIDRSIDDELDSSGYMQLLELPKVEDRYHCIYELRNMELYDKWVNEGNYLIFAIAFEWVSKIVYCTNTTELYDNADYPEQFIFKNSKEINNKYSKVLFLANSNNKEKYLVNYDIITKIQEDECFGNYDFITFSISPKYTPRKSDFIIDIIKEYIDEI